MSNRETHTAWTAFLDGIRRFVASRVPSSDVDDVVQDAMLRVAESEKDVREADRIQSFVFTITRRTIADYYRRRERSVDLVDAEAAEFQATGDDPDAAHDVHEEVLSWLRPMAEDLPEGYREALILADFEGIKQQEIADRLGLSLSGAKSRVQRARVLLGESLRSCCEVEFGENARAVAYQELEDCEDC